MPKLKVMSGQDIVKILESLGFSVVKQKGSHIKLDKGTLKAIFIQMSQFISDTELRKHFYTK